MRKKFLMLICAFCFILPCAFILSACNQSKDETPEKDMTKITYLWKGEVYHVQEVENGSVVHPLGDPEKPGYTFLGWYTDEEMEYKFNPNMYTPSGKDLTLYAKYSLDPYTVNYHLGEGETTTNPDSINVETSLHLQPATKDGYRFMGWFTNANFTNEQTTISEGTLSNLDLYPRFLQLYSISYNNTYNFENWPLEDWPMEFTEEDHIILPTAPNTETKEFYNWSTSWQHVNVISEIPTGTTENITVYPKYYDYASVTYNMGSGGEHNPLNPTKLSIIHDNVLYDPILKPGYEFVRWNSYGNIYAEIIYETEPTVRTVLRFNYNNSNPVTLSAQYDIILYNIGYYLNGGINNDSNPSLYNVTTSCILENPTRHGYAFIGWYTDENFQNPIQKIENLTGTLTLYARWAQLNNEQAYEINSVNDFRLLSHVNHVTWDVVLNTDIDLQGEAITIQKYTGVFDGKNHTIKNCSTSVINQVINGTIKNLNGTININSKIYAPDASWVAFVGFIGESAGSTIINCSVNGSINISEKITSHLSDFSIGGLIASVESRNDTPSYIKQCSANVNIEVIFPYTTTSVDYLNIGGLIGYLYGDSVVENCYSAGNLLASVDTYSDPTRINLGGLVGQIADSYLYNSTYGSISNSFSTVNVELNCNNKYSDRNMYIGGFIGGLLCGMENLENADFLVSKCYASGNVKISNKLNNPDYYDYAYTGGFVGRKYFNSSNNPNIENSFVFSGQTIDGGNILSADYITSTTMEEIWIYIVENWDSEIWNLTTTGNPNFK